MSVGRVDEHDAVFVIEQNRDGQMRKLLIQELEVHPKKMLSVLNYDGTPVTADFIQKTISTKLSETPHIYVS